MEYAFFALLAFCFLQGWLAHRERKDWAAERRLLMVRIQAPEVAVRLDANASTDTPKAVGLPYDDDEAFHRHRREIEMS